VRTPAPSIDRKRSRPLMALAAAVLLAMLATLACARDDSNAAGRGDEGEPVPTVWKATTPEPDGIRGRWREARGIAVTPEQQAELERLGTLGYLAGGSAAPSWSGVTVHDETRSWDGLNLYVSGDFAGARLMDMDGNTVHEWHCEFDTAWPDRHKEAASERGAEYWFHAHLFKNGDIIGVFNGLGLVKLDRDSNIIWRYEGGPHHDLHVADDGTIHAISHREKIDPRIHGGKDVLEDAVTVLSSEGRELRRISLLEAFWNSDYASWIKAPVVNRATRAIDLFHTNQIVELDGRLADRIPAFRRGNFLLSMRNLNLLAVLDPRSEEIVWTMAGMWLQQHCPSVLEDGSILLFDNQGDYGRSRILEFDPVTQEVGWMYKGNSENEFASELFGSAQRLPNGNTLIAESHYGRAFEVTRGGDIVWEYYNPARAGDDDELIGNLFRIDRLPQDFPTDWLE